MIEQTMTAPSRPWSFTLPTLFVVVTVAGACAMALAWLVNLPRPRVISGDLIRGEVPAICTAIAKFPDVRDKRVGTIKAYGRDTVAVITGTERGPVDLVWASKKSGAWVVTGGYPTDETLQPLEDSPAAQHKSADSPAAAVLRLP